MVDALNKYGRGKGKKKLVFLWLAVNDRLPTTFWRSTWLTTLPIYQFCEAEVEDELHIFKACYFTRQVWAPLIHGRYVSKLYTYGLKDWMCLNLHEDLRKEVEGGWSQILGVVLWLL